MPTAGGADLEAFAEHGAEGGPGSRQLGTQAILRSWELARIRPRRERPASLLQALWPDPSRHALDLPLGIRNRRLLQLRVALFGDALEAVSGCDACGARLELSLRASELDAGRPDGPEEVTVEHGGAWIRASLPTTRDLIEILAGPGVSAGALLERCVREVTVEGRPVEIEALPAEALQATESALADADPHTEIRLRTRCLECGAAGAPVLEVGDFLFGELERWARGILLQVHVLAGAYGWTEQEILRLSPERRLAYLDLVEGRL